MRRFMMLKVPQGNPLMLNRKEVRKFRGMGGDHSKEQKKWQLNESDRQTETEIQRGGRQREGAGAGGRETDTDRERQTD